MSRDMSDARVSNTTKDSQDDSTLAENAQCQKHVVFSLWTVRKTGGVHIQGVTKTVILTSVVLSPLVSRFRLANSDWISPCEQSIINTCCALWQKLINLLLGLMVIAL